MLHHDAPRLLPSSITMRRAVAADLPAMAEADGRSFGEHHTEEDLADVRALFDPDRYLLAEEDGEIVGITGSYPFDVTLPGGAAMPAAGVSWVSVAVTHRRRGILRALLAEQHRGFVTDGVALSLLTASEGGIYGRFGYGIATEHREVEIARRRAVFRSDVPDPGGVRQVGTAEMRRIDGIEYYNDGDWVEGCTALVEHYDGTMEILHWAEEMAARDAPESEVRQEAA